MVWRRRQQVREEVAEKPEKPVPVEFELYFTWLQLHNTGVSVAIVLCSSSALEIAQQISVQSS